MTTDLYMVLASVVLYFLTVLTAAILLMRGWTWDGLTLMFSNRDAMPLASPVAGRAERASKNLQENLVMFVPLVLVAHIGGGDPARVVLGAKIFLVARVLHWPTYIAGYRYPRTGLWFLGVIGMWTIASSLFVGEGQQAGVHADRAAGAGGHALEHPWTELDGLAECDHGLLVGLGQEDGQLADH